MKIKKIMILLMILCICFIPTKVFAKTKKAKKNNEGVILKVEPKSDTTGDTRENTGTNFGGAGAGNPANDISSLTASMGGVSSATASGKIATVINMVIKLIQVTGTGISVLMLTMLGVKYMLASSGEKADIKKMATPMIIGCVLLFGAVNLVGIIASVGIGLG